LPDGAIGFARSPRLDGAKPYPASLFVETVRRAGSP